MILKHPRQNFNKVILFSLRYKKSFDNLLSSVQFVVTNCGTVMERLGSNSSEVLQNLEEIFPRYYVENEVINKLKYSITHWCVIRRERFNPRQFASSCYI